MLTAPGLSVITRAIEEARRIFERMTSYAIYRIAETIRLLLFMTASILIFNFYPVTAIMVVLLALLNDLPIMMIALIKATRDYAHKYAQPVIIPGGIPVDVDAIARRQHEAAMGSAATPPSEPKLVQILPANSAFPAAPPVSESEKSQSFEQISRK